MFGRIRKLRNQEGFKDFDGRSSRDLGDVANRCVIDCFGHDRRESIANEQNFRLDVVKQEIVDSARRISKNEWKPTRSEARIDGASISDPSGAPEENRRARSPGMASSAALRPRNTQDADWYIAW